MTQVSWLESYRKAARRSHLSTPPLCGSAKQSDHSHCQSDRRGKQRYSSDRQRRRQLWLMGCLNRMPHSYFNNAKHTVAYCCFLLLGQALDWKYPFPSWLYLLCFLSCHWRNTVTELSASNCTQHNSKQPFQGQTDETFLLDSILFIIREKEWLCKSTTNKVSHDWKLAKCS